MRIIVLALLLVSFSSMITADVASFVSSGRCNNFAKASSFKDLSGTVADIQAELVLRNSALATYTENGLPASQIMYNCMHGLNSDSTGSAKDITISAATGTISWKVMMLMLEGQQNLITSSSPTQYSLDWAMGYVTGNTSYKGFAKQVGWGAWQLRFNYEGALRGPEWWQTWYPGNTTTWAYVGMTKNISGYSIVTYDNAAVAALYRYNPSIWGANNFYENGSNWFPEMVPEPSAFVAMACGLAGLASFRKRKR